MAKVANTKQNMGILAVSFKISAYTVIEFYFEIEYIK